MVKLIICDACLDVAYDESNEYHDLEGYTHYQYSSDKSFLKMICEDLGDTLSDHLCYNKEAPDEMEELGEKCVCACNPTLEEE